LGEANFRPPVVHSYRLTQNTKFGKKTRDAKVCRRIVGLIPLHEHEIKNKRVGGCFVVDGDMPMSYRVQLKIVTLNLLAVFSATASNFSVIFNFLFGVPICT